MVVVRASPAGRARDAGGAGIVPGGADLWRRHREHEGLYGRRGHAGRPGAVRELCSIHLSGGGSGRGVAAVHGSDALGDTPAAVVPSPSLQQQAVPVARLTHTPYTPHKPTLHTVASPRYLPGHHAPSTLAEARTEPLLHIASVTQVVVFPHRRAHCYNTVSITNGTSCQSPAPRRTAAGPSPLAPRGHAEPQHASGHQAALHCQVPARGVGPVLGVTPVAQCRSEATATQGVH